MKISSRPMVISNISIRRNNKVNQNQENKEKINNPKDQKENSSLVVQAPRNEKQSYLNGLEKQRQKLVDRKNMIIKNGMEKGLPSDSINEQLKDVDQSIKDIDKQIQKAIQDEQEKKAEKAKESKENRQEKIEEGNSSEKIIKLDSHLKNFEAMNSQRKKGEGEARVLKGEIKLDAARGVDTSKKEDTLSKLESSTENITKKMSKQIEEVSKESKFKKMKKAYALNSQE